MASNIRKLGVLIALAAVLMLAVVLMASSYVEIGVIDDIGTGGTVLRAYDFSTVPQTVVEDASRLSTELFGNAQEKSGDFVDQLLSTYLDAKDEDFVLLFNSGGWGWKMAGTSSSWNSIFDGIKSELDNLGYKALILNYRRTSETLLGRIDELKEVITTYPSKAKYLASRVEFLTNHIPDLKVIVAGESTGTIISDCVMSDLQENQRVYSIQTGPPFWHKYATLDRTLVLKSNGVIPDSFSYGDVSTVLWATVKGWFGFTGTEDHHGDILHFLKAPGHDYSWQYPAVASQIIKFIDVNFGAEQR